MAELMDRKKLIEYLPRFMQNFSELKELLRVANEETDLIHTQIGRILDEAFIESCTEYGLRKYENLLHIIPADGESLETRRLRVMMRWYEYSPYTFRVLVNKLNMICGVNNYDLTADLENYYFRVQTELGSYGSMDELAYMYESILPQNIFYESVNVLNIEAACSLNYGGGLVMSTMFQLTEDWKGSQSITADLSIGGGIVFSEKMMLTEDYTASGTIEGNALIGGGVVSSEMHTLTEDYTQEGVIEGDAYVTGGAVIASKELITNDFKETATISGNVNYAAGIVQAEFFEVKS